MKFVRICIIAIICLSITNYSPLGKTRDSNVALADNTSSLGLHQVLADHSFLEIDNDKQLLTIVQQEGWSGDGSVKHPFVIEGYRFSEGQKITTFGEFKTQIVYLLGGYEQVSLILREINSHVKISGNEFMYSVVIIHSDNVEISKNSWVTEFYPWNLFIAANNVLVNQNTFSGVNKDCLSDSNSDFTPRVYSYGDGMIFSQNLFTSDYGCEPIENLVLDRPPTGPSLGYQVDSNYFNSSQLAINSRSGYKVTISNNDFMTGDFAILVNGQSGFDISRNNFYETKKGFIGQQNYSGVIDYVRNLISPVYRQSPEWNGDNGLKPGVNVHDNYYEGWTEPDKNHDGIVDNGYPIAANKVDASPSTKPNPGYYGSFKDDSNSKLMKNTIIALGVISIIGLGGWLSYIKLIKTKPVFTGDLNGVPEKFIEELFESQTILYYTLVGQNRIQDKEIENGIKEAIPHNILSYKFLLHPVRLSIMKLLYENLGMTSLEILKILKISWNDYYTHAQSLQKRSYVRIEEQFVDGNKRQVLTIEPTGIAEYKVLTDLLHLFLDNSTDYAAYIKTAQDHMNSQDVDLYPKK